MTDIIPKMYFMLMKYGVWLQLVIASRFDSVFWEMAASSGYFKENDNALPQLQRAEQGLHLALVPVRVTRETAFASVMQARRIIM